MNVRYFILTIALVPSIAYTAEITPPKKEDRTLKHQRSASNYQESSSKQLKKHPKKESATLSDKPNADLTRKISAPKYPLPIDIIHITSLTQPITFNGATQSLYEWLRNHKKNKFGLTRVLEAQVTTGTFTEKGNVCLANDTDNLKAMLARQNAIYISNIEERESIQYGAIIHRDGLTIEADPSKRVAITANFFLLWLIDQEIKSKKSDDKKKEELTEVSAEFNKAATKALEALQ